MMPRFSIARAYIAWAVAWWSVCEVSGTAVWQGYGGTITDRHLSNEAW